MTNNFNNQNPENQPGWASGSGYNSGSVPPQNPYGQQPGYPQQPNPYGQQPGGYPQAPKKSKLWLWITLAIIIPLFLCGISVGGCAFFAAKSLTPPVDATNDFYAAAKAGEDLDPYTCERYLDEGSSFNDVFESEPDIDSYNFSEVDITNGIATVSGQVVRDGTTYRAEIELEKDNGKYKVCYVTES